MCAWLFVNSFTAGQQACSRQCSQGGVMAPQRIWLLVGGGVWEGGELCAFLSGWQSGLWVGLCSALQPKMSKQLLHWPQLLQCLAFI